VIGPIAQSQFNLTHQSTLMAREIHKRNAVIREFGIKVALAVVTKNSPTHDQCSCTQGKCLNFSGLRQPKNATSLASFGRSVLGLGQPGFWNPYTPL
jgi:hypothetical protein